MRNGRFAVVFLDSNIWGYALIVQDPRKRAIAQRIISQAVREDGFAISTQVISECANVLFNKGKKDPQEIIGCINYMNQLELVVQVTTLIARRAVEIKALYGLQFYDAQIVAAAESVGCTELWSEDMGDGQNYCGVRCINPFQEGATADHPNF